MENTINVQVNYRASEGCRKLLLAQGRDANIDQTIVVVMPTSALDLLPISVDNNGTAELFLQENHYKITGHVVDAVIGWGSGDYTKGGYNCHCCNKATHSTELSNPINNYDDVLNLIKGNAERKTNVEVLLVNKQLHEAELKELQQSITDELTKKFTQEYSNAVEKITQIKTLIENKTRVRTSQIKDIIG